MLKKIIKNILNFFNYILTSKKDWNKKVENLIVEASDDDLKMFSKIYEISLTSMPNRLSLLQSLTTSKIIASKVILWRQVSLMEQI